MMLFLFVTFGWSWAIWLTLRATVGVAPAGHETVWIAALLGGAIGPTVGAIVATAAHDGRRGVGALLRRYVVWRVHVVWYLVAVLLPTAVYGVAIAIYVQHGHTVGAVVFPGLVALTLAYLSAIPAGPICEELGWRGFLLPALQRRHRALTSSVLVGVAWFVWHLPLMWMAAGTLISGARVTVGTLAVYFVWIQGASLLMTWLANNTRESVLLAVLMHAGFNAAQPLALLPTIPPDAIRPISYLTVIPVACCAALIVAVFGPAHLRRSKSER